VSSNFYVYALTVNGVVKYVGKGSARRVKSYSDRDLKRATPYVREQLLAARVRGDAIGHLILGEFAGEAEAYAAEREWIRRYPAANLWNLSGVRRPRRPHGDAGRLILAAQDRTPVGNAVVDPEEARALNLPAGRVELGETQTKALRQYRYQHAMRVGSL
jgi:hypothetical protein